MDALSYAPVCEGQVKSTRWKRSLLLWHKGTPQQWAGCVICGIRPICLLLQSARLPACRRHEHASPELRKYNGSETSTAACQVSLGAGPGRALVVDAASMRGGEQQGTAATVVNMTATGHAVTMWQSCTRRMHSSLPPASGPQRKLAGAVTIGLI